MLQEIKDNIYDFYVLNIREFYKRWVKDFWKRCSIPRNLPDIAYREQMLDIPPLGVTELDDKYFASLRRNTGKAVKKLKLEGMINLN